MEIRKEILSDGREYNGQWLDGKPHGIGQITTPDGGVSKKGTWKNGVRINWIEDEEKSDHGCNLCS